MVSGLFTAIYHPKKGIVVEVREPDNLIIDPLIVTKLFTEHINKNNFKESKIVLFREDSTYVSYFTGEPDFYMISIIVTLDENWEYYFNFLDKLKSRKLAEINFKNIFNQISKTIKLSPEQENIMILINPIKNSIFEILHEKGITAENNLFFTLKQKGYDENDIKLAMIELEKMKYISTLVFNNKKYILLTKDYLIYRSTPPKDIIRELTSNFPPEIAAEVLIEIYNFLNIYRENFPNKIDEKAIIDLIKDKLLYKIINILRRKIMKAEDLIEYFFNPDIISGLERLIGGGFVYEFNFNNKKYYILKSDPQIVIFRPYYVIKKVIQKFKDIKIKELIKKFNFRDLGGKN
ncbi:MAG: hypothetical protein ACTSYR_01585 [Candidatus Odinarchaeia archaeon]